VTDPRRFITGRFEKTGKTRLVVCSRRPAGTFSPLSTASLAFRRYDDLTNDRGPVLLVDDTVPHARDVFQNGPENNSLGAISRRSRATNIYIYIYRVAATCLTAIDNSDNPRDLRDRVSGNNSVSYVNIRRIFTVYIICR